MGRGRAKAKQTKVARDLKYRTWDTDLDQLRRELSAQSDSRNAGNGSDGDGADEDDDADYEQYRS